MIKTELIFQKIEDYFLTDFQPIDKFILFQDLFVIILVNSGIFQVNFSEFKLEWIVHILHKFQTRNIERSELVHERSWGYFTKIGIVSYQRTLNPKIN